MIDFPNAPTLNQVFVAAGKSWSWDGGKWVVTAGGGGTASGDILEVNLTTMLPLGFAGFVSVGNTSGGAIMITLPPFPNPNQTVLVKDTLGNATLFPITVSGGGFNIENKATVVITYNYSWLELIFTGVQWVQI